MQVWPSSIVFGLKTTIKNASSMKTYLLLLFVVWFFVAIFVPAEFKSCLYDISFYPQMHFLQISTRVSVTRNLYIFIKRPGKVQCLVDVLD